MANISFIEIPVVTTNEDILDEIETVTGYDLLPTYFYKSDRQVRAYVVVRQVLLDALKDKDVSDDLWDLLVSIKEQLGRYNQLFFVLD